MTFQTLFNLFVYVLLSVKSIKYSTNIYGSNAGANNENFFKSLNYTSIRYLKWGIYNGNNNNKGIIITNVKINKNFQFNYDHSQRSINKTCNTLDLINNNSLHVIKSYIYYTNDLITGIIFETNNGIKYECLHNIQQSQLSVFDGMNSIYNGSIWLSGLKLKYSERESSNDHFVSGILLIFEYFAGTNEKLKGVNGSNLLHYKDTVICRPKSWEYSNAWISGNLYINNYSSESCYYGAYQNNENYFISKQFTVNTNALNYHLKLNIKASIHISNNSYFKDTNIDIIDTNNQIIYDNLLLTSNDSINNCQNECSYLVNVNFTLYNINSFKVKFKTKFSFDYLYDWGVSHFELNGEIVNNPTMNPTVFIVPTSYHPTNSPFDEHNTPTSTPSYSPTSSPTSQPTLKPTIVPTMDPTLNPSMKPSIIPTVDPSTIPTINPSNGPTMIPTIMPTIEPSNAPTVVSIVSTPTQSHLEFDVKYEFTTTATEEQLCNDSVTLLKLFEKSFEDTTGLISGRDFKIIILSIGNNCILTRRRNLLDIAGIIIDSIVECLSPLTKSCGALQQANTTQSINNLVTQLPYDIKVSVIDDISKHSNNITMELHNSLNNNYFNPNIRFTFSVNGSFDYDSDGPVITQIIWYCKHCPEIPVNYSIFKSTQPHIQIYNQVYNNTQNKVIHFYSLLTLNQDSWNGGSQLSIKICDDGFIFEDNSYYVIGVKVSIKVIYLNTSYSDNLEEYIYSHTRPNLDPNICDVSPKTGISLQTKFKISCNNLIGNDTYYYNFYYPNIFISTGDSSNNFDPFSIVLGTGTYTIMNVILDKDNYAQCVNISTIDVSLNNVNNVKFIKTVSDFINSISLNSNNSVSKIVSDYVSVINTIVSYTNNDSNFNSLTSNESRSLIDMHLELIDNIDKMLNGTEKLSTKDLLTITNSLFDLTRPVVGPDINKLYYTTQDMKNALNTIDNLINEVQNSLDGNNTLDTNTAKIVLQSVDNTMQIRSNVNSVENANDASEMGDTTIEIINSVGESLISESKVGETVVVESDSIKLGTSKFEADNYIESNCPSDVTNISLPSQYIYSFQSSVLECILFKQSNNTYDPSNNSNLSFVGNFINVQIKASEAMEDSIQSDEYSFLNVCYPILITIPNTHPQNYINNSDYPQCLFWNETTKQFDNNTMYVIHKDSNHTICATLHTTYFGVNNEKNYKLKKPILNTKDLQAIASLNWDNIWSHPVGPIVVIVLLVVMMFIYFEVPTKDDTPLIYAHMNDKDFKIEEYRAYMEHKIYTSNKSFLSKSFSLWILRLKNDHEIFSLCLRNKGTGYNGKERVSMLLMKLISMIAINGLFYGTSQKNTIGDWTISILGDLLSLPVKINKYIFKKYQFTHDNKNDSTDETIDSINNDYTKVNSDTLPTTDNGELELQILKENDTIKRIDLTQILPLTESEEEEKVPELPRLISEGTAVNTKIITPSQHYQIWTPKIDEIEKIQAKDLDLNKIIFYLEQNQSYNNFETVEKLTEEERKELIKALAHKLYRSKIRPWPHWMLYIAYITIIIWVITCSILSLWWAIRFDTELDIKNTSKHSKCPNDFNSIDLNEIERMSYNISQQKVINWYNKHGNNSVIIDTHETPNNDSFGNITPSERWLLSIATSYLLSIFVNGPIRMYLLTLYKLLRYKSTSVNEHRFASFVLS